MTKAVHDPQNRPHFRCTPEAQSLVERYLNQQKAERDDLDRRLFAFLEERKYDEAIEAFLQYQNQHKSIFPSSPFSLGPMPRAEYLRTLRVIFENTPKILASMDKDKLATLRTATAMGYVFGSKVPGYPMDMRQVFNWTPRRHLGCCIFQQIISGQLLKSNPLVSRK